MRKNIIEAKVIKNVKMKRRVSIVLMAAMIAATITGCGGSTATSDVSSTANSKQPVYSTDNAAEANVDSAPEEAVAADCMEIDSAAAPMSSATNAKERNIVEDLADSIWGDEAEVEPVDNFNTEEYDAVKEEGFKSVANSPLSTFSADVDTASYTNIRRMIEDGYSLESIPQGAVRIEEMLNYFSYDYNLPKKGEPFGVTTVIGDCPWNEDAKLLQIGLKTQEIDFSEAPDSNLVFLIDVSGSMYDENKLPLLQKAFCMLVDELAEKDKISIVTYAGNDEVVLKGVSGDEKDKIKDAINGLEAHGSTNGADGIETAYKLAEKNFIKGGNNRVILATDGDLNVGVSSESELKKLVEKKKKTGVFLSVLGFGTGNIKDNKMETLADNGDGNYSYIDSVMEAKKVMVEEMGANFVTVAKDVKLQVEFNPAYIKGYRLLGYDNRVLATEDFDDDTKDAGEIGAGHTVTALYEIITVDSKQDIAETNLKYQDNDDNNKGVKNGEWMNLKIRYKEPDGDESKLCEYPITEDSYEKCEECDDFNFAAAVAEFGLILKDSEYKGDASFDNVKSLLKSVDTDSDEYKDEFTYLVKKLEKNS